jgi:hypothetical protein
VAVGAAGAAEVVLPLAVTAEAGIAGRCRLLLVAAVAIGAGLMLDLEVQPGQLFGLMATGAGRWLGDAIGTVGTMAGEATAAQFAMGTAGFLGVAAAAGLACGGTAVRLVAPRAVLVPARSRLVF